MTAALATGLAAALILARFQGDAAILPLAVGLPTLFGFSVQLFRDLRGQGVRNLPSRSVPPRAGELRGERRPHDQVTVTTAIALVLLLVLLGWVIGILLAGAVVAMIVQRGVDGRAWLPALLFSTGLFAAAYVVFELVLQMRLHGGVLW